MDIIAYSLATCNKKLSCWRETARRFVPLNILLIFELSDVQ